MKTTKPVRLIRCECGAYVLPERMEIHLLLSPNHTAAVALRKAGL